MYVSALHALRWLVGRVVSLCVCVCGESLLMRFASIAMVAGGGGGGVVVGVVGERDDDLF